MSDLLMILPASQSSDIRLVRVPDEFDLADPSGDLFVDLRHRGVADLHQHGWVG